MWLKYIEILYEITRQLCYSRIYTVHSQQKPTCLACNDSLLTEDDAVVFSINVMKCIKY